eukprot:TRINITY_DN25310_c0_g1_i1.p2 TRINITY_DN25310_c0_g1~~TRINITY_DN25310_c0_g1_i1.p2  ORF type:complete len:135 (+),score=31.42 TRINITY_DN25310_c0_g1_i1:128-532(+)
MCIRDSLRAMQEEIAEETRKKAVVQLAIGTLSYSELEAVEHIFDELDGDEGLLVASKIADKVGITRSVIVNALRKFESAGVIESRSLGVKGTYITVSYTHLRAHETSLHLVCRLLLEKKKKQISKLKKQQTEEG